MVVPVCVSSLPCMFCVSCAADTSLTNVFAFMLGSITLLPAVEYFCFYAGTAVLFDFILQVRGDTVRVSMPGCT